MGGNTQLDTYWAHKRELESHNDFPENFEEMLDRAANIFGDDLALNCFDQGQALSYKELRAKALCLADGLHSAGLKKGTHVAVMLSNRIEYHITWLALGVLGAVMLPVNTRYTAHEVSYLIDDGDAEFFITESQFLAVFQRAQKNSPGLSLDNLIMVDEGAPSKTSWQSLLCSGSSEFSPSWKVCGHDLMNIQYTSGTTGFPKGCMQPQSYWILIGASMADFNPTIKSILSDHAFFYMDPQWQLTFGLCVGATVYSASNLSSSKFLERVQKYQIEMAFFPRPLVSEISSSSNVKTSLKKLYTIGVGANVQRKISEALGVWAFEAFGMTEVGVGLMVPEELEGDRDVLGSCGIAGPFREAKVSRDDGSECAVDEVGELWLRGESMFQGYYKKPDANAESFSDGWFKTGDLFVRCDKNYLKIVGRKKDMIRRSSENISALEVEQALSVHPKIKQAAAVPVSDDYRGEEVKIYLLLRDGETKVSMPPEAVIEHCRGKLAEFKIPRFIEYVSELPHTPSEKVAKHKLLANVVDLRAGSWDAVEKKWN